MSLLLQLKAEMDRIVNKDPSKTASEKWATLMPKVFKIADAENNPNIATFINLDDNVIASRS